MPRLYDHEGEEVRPEDVLDREELEAYYRHPNRTTTKSTGLFMFRDPEDRREEAEWGGDEA